MAKSTVFLEQSGGIANGGSDPRRGQVQSGSFCIFRAFFFSVKEADLGPKKRGEKKIRYSLLLEKG